MLDFSHLPSFDCHVHVPSLDDTIASTWTPARPTCDQTIRYLDRLNIRGAVLFGSDLTICDPATVIARVACADLDDPVKHKILRGNALSLLKRHGVTFDIDHPAR